ncbi:MAG: hypothetical protein M3320_06720 [Actinomycetota bacterium]|nr:hypothetical protein [Actinomycetota bacterium]MDQ5808353.1 hypothetical protein [Actinomycetota bacterium]
MRPSHAIRQLVLALGLLLAIAIPYLLVVEAVSARRSLAGDLLTLTGILLALLVAGLTILTTGIAPEILARRPRAYGDVLRGYVWTFRIAFGAAFAALAYKSVAQDLDEWCGVLEDATFVAMALLFFWSATCTFVLVSSLRVIALATAKEAIEEPAP